MVVLSLFDGMSCGQIALRELGLPIAHYYASEVDKHAIAQTQLNFPSTIQLGDVEQWRNWGGIDWGGIDLILAGSPCQGFSLAGKMLGLEDHRSRLFWVFVEILQHVRQHNPNVRYLLENVRMKPEHERIISETLGVFPVVINSSLVSAQNRVRLYWSDIRVRQDGLFAESYTDIPQPEDRGLAIADIIEDSVDEKYYLSDAGVAWLYGHTQKRCANITILNDGDKSRTLTISNTTKYNGDSNYIIQRPRGANPGGEFAYKSPTLTSCAWEANNLLVSKITAGTRRTHKDGNGFRAMAGEKCGAVTTRARQDGSGQGAVQIGYRLRRLTPTECARLQTIPSWYQWACTDTQAYKMLGNGWTVEVIKHILSHYEYDKE